MYEPCKQIPAVLPAFRSQRPRRPLPQPRIGRHAHATPERHIPTLPLRNNQPAPQDQRPPHLRPQPTLRIHNLSQPQLRHRHNSSLFERPTNDGLSPLNTWLTPTHPQPPNSHPWIPLLPGTSTLTQSPLPLSSVLQGPLFSPASAPHPRRHPHCPIVAIPKLQV